jgi:SAM-dependent methyltransferase
MKAGQHREETRARELRYWSLPDSLKYYADDLPLYQSLFPFHEINYSTTNILDVGSGPISVFEEITPPNAKVVPYDTLANEYNAIAPNKKFAIHENIPERQYELITMFNMLDHMDEPKELLELLTHYLAPGGRVWIYVHIDRPFSPAEHPQCFRFWRLPKLAGQYFSITSCGLVRQERAGPYAFWAVCSAKLGDRLYISQIAKMAAHYIHFQIARPRSKKIQY